MAAVADASSVRFCQYTAMICSLAYRRRTVVFLLKLTAERFLFCGFSSLVYVWEKLFVADYAAG